MDVFELIKNNEDITSLFIDKINKKKYINEFGKMINPIEYALLINNLKAFTEMILYVKENPTNDGKEIINKEFLNDLFKNKHHGIVFFSHIELPIKQKYKVLEQFSILWNAGSDYGIKKEELILPQELKKALGIDNFNYQDLQQLGNDFEEFNTVFIKDDIVESISLFKEIIKNYRDDYSYFVLYNKDVYNPFEAIANKIDELLLQCDTAEKIQEFLLNKVSLILKEEKEYKEVSEENENSYLYLDPYYEKIKSYIDLSERLKQESIKEVLNHFLENNINKKDRFLMRNPYDFSDSKNNIHQEQLQKLLEKRQLKTLVVPRHLNVIELIQKIENGFKGIEKEYNLTPKQTGGNLLSIHFTLYLMKNSSAGLEPNGNLIIFGKNNLENNNLDDIMIHEYSHYMQSQKYKKELLQGYTKESSSLLNQETLWTDIQDKVFHIKINLNDAIKYSSEVIEKERDYLYRFMDKDIDMEEVKAYITNNIILSAESYKENMENFLYSLKRSDIIEIYEKEVNTTINNCILELVAIKRSYNKKSFFKNMWKEIDLPEKKVYLNNQFEMHSRLMENLVNEEKVKDIRYGTKELIEDIKPHLKKFNNMLSSHYKNILIKTQENKNRKKINENFNISI